GGCVTAVSVISCRVAVVPRRSRFSPLAADQSSRRAEAPGSSSHGASMPAFWDPCPGEVRQSTSIRQHSRGRFGRCSGSQKLTPDFVGFPQKPSWLAVHLSPNGFRYTV